jgi:hypothetical protein
MSRPTAISERTIRPNDVPGRLLNMALLNLGSDDPNLRLSSYNLLYALSRAFHFDVGNQLLDAKGNSYYHLNHSEAICLSAFIPYRLVFTSQ